MKKSILCTIATVFAFAAISASTDSTDSIKGNVKLIDTGNNSIKVLSNPIDKGNVIVKIVDDNSNMIHRASINAKDGFLQRFNLAELKEGNYHISIEHKKQTLLTRDVEVKNHKFDLENIGEGKYQVTVNNRNSEKFELSILTQNNQLVGHDQIETAGGYSKVYDLSALESQQFVFELTSLDSGISEKRFVK
jgi:hypothetical protein